MIKKYDLNRMRKTYPLIKKKPKYAKVDNSMIETARIDISDGLPKTYTFINEYFSAPICVVTPENDNVNAFISSVNQTSVTIEVSAQPLEQCYINLQIFKEV